MKPARQRYSELSMQRNQFLDVAYDCSQITLPYLISNEYNEQGDFQEHPHSLASSGCEVCKHSGIKTDVGSTATSDYLLQATSQR